MVKTPNDLTRSSARQQTVLVNGEKVKLVLIWSEKLMDMWKVEWPHIIVYLMQSCG